MFTLFFYYFQHIFQKEALPIDDEEGETSKEHLEKSEGEQKQENLPTIPETTEEVKLPTSCKTTLENHNEDTVTPSVDESLPKEDEENLNQNRENPKSQNILKEESKFTPTTKSSDSSEGEVNRRNILHKVILPKLIERQQEKLRIYKDADETKKFKELKTNKQISVIKVQAIVECFTGKKIVLSSILY